VITSDHGEEFHDHGHYGHGWSLYEAVLHMPLLVYREGEFEGGMVVPHPVHGVDLAPTLAAAAGALAPADWVGVPLALTPPERDRPLFVPFFSRKRGKPSTALFVGSRKFIDYPRGERPDDPHQGPMLYDLRADPDELVNLWSSAEEGAWRERVQELWQRYPLRVDDRTAPAGAELREELRALGYLAEEE